MIPCPNCGKEFEKKDQSFFGHLSVCTRNLPDDVKAEMLKKARSDEPSQASSIPPATDSPDAAPSKPAAASVATFAFEDEPAVPISEDTAKQSDQQKPAAPGAPGQPEAVKAPSAAVEELKSVFQFFGSAWNEYLQAPDVEPDVTRYRWTEKHTQLGADTLLAVDRKWGLKSVEDITPYLLIASFIAAIGTLVVGGLRAKGKIRPRQGVQSSGSQGFTPAEEKEAAAAWEAELKGRSEGKGPVTT